MRDNKDESLPAWIFIKRGKKRKKTKKKKKRKRKPEKREESSGRIDYFKRLGQFEKHRGNRDT